MLISIIIPTKNEPYINRLVKNIHKKVWENHEVIVVDKSDITPKITGAKLLRQKSDELGNAILEGVEEAKGDIIVFMDGDGSHNPEYINQMLKHIPQYDIVIGSRYVKGGHTEDNPKRVFVSKILNSLIAHSLGLNVKDLMSGFAMIKKRIFKKIKLKPRGYKILLEIVYKSKTKVKEIPITFYQRKAGKPKVGFNTAGIKEVIRIFIIVLSLKLSFHK